MGKVFNVVVTETELKTLPLYIVKEKGLSTVVVDRHDQVIAYFSSYHPYTEKAAQAECERLNKEYRKAENHGQND